MSDNLNYTEPTSGRPVATDEVSGTHFQRMKLDVGADGVSTPITGTTRYGIPVDVKSTSCDTVSTSGIPLSTKWAIIDFTLGGGGGDATIVTGVSGRRIRVLAITLSVSKNTTLIFKSGLATNKTGSMSMNQGNILDVNRMPFGFFVETNPGDAFVINASNNAVVGGSLTYIEA